MFKTKNDDNIFYKYIAGAISREELEQLVSKELGLNFRNILDEIPKDTEYKNWNNEALKKQLERFGKPKEEFFELAKNELRSLLVKRN
jgi:hypothetical protein